MPASVIGSDILGVQVGVASRSGVFPIPAGCNFFLAMGGGFGKNSGTAAFTGATVDGNAIPVASPSITRATNQQFSAIFGMGSDHPDWPGTGNTTIQINASEADDIGLIVVYLQDVDLAVGVRDTDGNVGDSPTPALAAAITSSANDVVVSMVASYSAAWAGDGNDTLLEQEANSTSLVSITGFSEPGAASVTPATAYASSVFFAMNSVSIAGTAGGGGANARRRINGGLVNGMGRINNGLVYKKPPEPAFRLKRAA